MEDVEAPKEVNQFEISEIVQSRLEEILTLAKKEIRSLTSRNIDYVIVTGGTSNMANFNYIAKEVFGNIAKIGNVKLIGIRNNKYSSAVGNIAYFVSSYAFYRKADYYDIFRNLSKLHLHSYQMCTFLFYQVLNKEFLQSFQTFQDCRFLQLH